MPNGYRDVSGKLVILVIIVSQATINNSEERDSAIQVSILIDGTVSSRWGPDEFLSYGLQTGERHVNLELCYHESDWMPNL